MDIIFKSLAFPLNYINYRHSYINGDVKIRRNLNGNDRSYNYIFYVKLGDTPSLDDEDENDVDDNNITNKIVGVLRQVGLISSFQVNTTTSNEIKHEKLSEWVSEHFPNISSSSRKSYDCVMELSNNSKFVFKIVNAKITRRSNLFFYVNSDINNSIFNLSNEYKSYKLPLSNLLRNVKFFIFENFNLEDNLNIINTHQQFASNNLNNLKNGQLISITKVGTVLKNSVILTGSDIPTCPEQNITVYKVLYFSSQNDQNGPQVLSGSILVPENVSKTEILQTRNGATFQFRDNTIIWYSVVNNLNFNDTSTNDKSTLLFSGLGYIVVHADGFGLGASEGKVSGNSDFSCEVYPHVDILRAVRPILPVFSPIVSIEPLNIIYCGYSNGSIYAPSIVHHFVPGNNQKMTSVEASKFNYKRMILGGVPYISTVFFKYIQQHPQDTLVILETFGLLSWFLGHNNSGIMMSRPSAYNEIIRPIALGDELGSMNGLTLQQQLGMLVMSNTLMHPPNSTDDVYIPATTRIGDVRQLSNINNSVLYGSDLTNNHGWTNPKIRLSNFPKIPVTMVYSSGDQVVTPTVGNSENAILKKIFNIPLLDGESAYKYDGTEYLDDYMGTGKVIGIRGDPSRSVTYPGANKTLRVEATFNDKTQNAVKEIASLIKNTTENSYLRIKIEPNNSRGASIESLNFGRATHGGGCITWMESTYYTLQ